MPPSFAALDHLRTLKRALNRAITAVKGGDRLVVESGWGLGFLSLGSAATTERAPRYRLYPSKDAPSERCPAWHDPAELIDVALFSALDFFWPGPLTVGVMREKERVRLACPWHPLASELLSRLGPCWWEPLSAKDELALSSASDLASAVIAGARVLNWPGLEPRLPLTHLDAGSFPWRLMETGFVEADELALRLPHPFVLSTEKAFPVRAFTRFEPEHRVVVLEAASSEELPGLVEAFRSKVGPDWAIRIYLDEDLAYQHFPEDRRVRVYGELSDPERVRRRLEAMLERQRRRPGKRVLVVGLAGLTKEAESLKTDLQKLADDWMVIKPGGELTVDGLYR